MIIKDYHQFLFPHNKKNKTKQFQTHKCIHTINIFVDKDLTYIY